MKSLESGVLSAARRSVVVSEMPTKQTSRGGPGYVHPRGKKYLDRFDDIFKKPICSCSGCNCEPEGDDEGDD
jgi:hypothetical protein